ncbi:hypothetical protein [Rheinheimera maricola]|uniref:Uncharacterized protein n=1 Tax=Rheinheimera maricola TaxID=2793282 RepID=A0ABS7X7G5_9GAMM|nr:hypothetical protein [Rheinheimera maricola]MBZ9611129.1 hypothetical protein [Rheinheimera maricola]
MIKLLFLMPLIMSLLWYGYLRQHGWSITQGKKGFAYIIAFNAIIALTLWLLMLLTAR